ncbi:MAG: transcriptional regulator [Alphaproteobacteria bacterium]|nr:transcriptional regulator [Alphaproteobacteria bacterium]
MNVRPIRNDRDYRRTLREVESLMNARPGGARGNRLDVLVTLVEAWEAKHYPVELPDAVEAIRYHMEQHGLSARDLVPYIGSRHRVYEVLNRRRPLTLRMVWKLHCGLGIPAEALIRPPDEKAA